MRKLHESIWSDIQDRSSGEATRKEDDVNLLDLNEFYKYIKDQYRTKVEYIDLEGMGGENGVVLGVDITEDIILFYKPERGHILLSWSKVKIPMPFFDELEDWFKIENPNVMRRIITEKDGSCTNKTFVDVIEFFLQHKDGLVNESIWSDIQDRSTGEQIRQEDDVNHFDLYEFYNYLNKDYKYSQYIWVFLDDKREFISVDYIQEGVKRTNLFLVIGGNDDKYLELPYSFSENHKDIFEKMSDVFVLELPHQINGDILNVGFIKITPKKGEVTNRFFIDVLEFILNECNPKGLDESVWSDIQDRSAGETVRKEDEMTQEDMDNLEDFLCSYATRIVYDDYEFSLDGLCDYIESNDREGIVSKDANIDHILNYVKMNWADELSDRLAEYVDLEEEERRQHMNESVWSDIQDRSTGEKERKEDDVNLLDPDSFVTYIRKNYRIDNTPYDIENRTNSGTEVPNIFIPICSAGTRNIKLGAIYFDYNDNEVYTHSLIKKYIPKLWAKLDQDFNLLDGNGLTFINPKDTSREVNNSYVLELLNYICDNLDDTVKPCISRKTNESVWSDIQDRSTGEKERKEDAIPEQLKKVLFTYAELFAYRDVFYGDYTLGSYPDFRAFIRDFENAPRIEALNPDINELMDYVKENWDDVVLPLLMDVARQVNDEENKIVDKFMDEMPKTNESVWSDIQDRSTGEKERKEDEVLDERENTVLGVLSKMFRNAVRVSSDPRNPVSYHYDDTCDGFVIYITRRKEEQRSTYHGEVVGRKVYDKIIKFVEKNWGDCKGIQDFMDKYLNGLNECDGVPGGVTPGCIGGMGPACFPGADGTPGSGDLPSPTGIVYQQVAPFSIFIKDWKKKKKKKKKFRKEDEPCVHSPNKKVYNYVDDYREYVDRTYNNIDRRR